MEMVPCLLFDGHAEEALQFYENILPSARMTDIMRGGEGGPVPQGGLIAATLEFAGQRLMVLNGPAATPSIAVSLFVACDTQDEVDRLWTALADGGSPLRCGWVTDRFGVTWQIAPKQLRRLLADPDPARARRAMQAMMNMVKLDIVEIERAADGAGRGTA